MSMSPEAAAAALESWDAYQQYRANHPPVSVGGSISGTDGTTTVNPLTSLRLPAGTLTDLGSGEGGVGLIVQLIGPFGPINFNTPHFTDDFDNILCVALSPGTLVLDAWVEVTTEFDSTVPYANLLVGLITGDPASDGSQGRNVHSQNSLSNITITPYLRFAAAQTAVELPCQVTTIDPTAGLFAGFNNSGGSVTQGSFVVYAIIATPAA